MDDFGVFRNDVVMVGPKTSNHPLRRDVEIGCVKKRPLFGDEEMSV